MPVGCSIGADSRGARLLVIHLYTPFPQPAVSAAILAASLEPVAASHGTTRVLIRCIFFAARSSFYHRFRFRFPVFFSNPTVSRWQICRNRKTDGKLMALYRTSLMVNFVYDNLDRNFARKRNICCNLKSLYHASFRVNITCNLIFCDFFSTQLERINFEYHERTGCFCYIYITML